jgi:undecaprenyl-diphosphatase
MQAYFQYLLDIFTQNPMLAVGVAFVVAVAEAVLVIGLFVPSTTVLVGIGGLIGLGKLPFWPVFWAVALGAAIGDAISYWIGHTYRERLYGMWPFSRYTSLLASGQEYFRVHGGKSVVIGRFIPGVKAVVPGIAGMMGMNPLRFTTLNVLSALAWAATHLLPGMSAGWVMASLGAISQRLALMFGLLLVVTVVLIWAGQYGIVVGLRYLPRWQTGFSRWGETYEGWGKKAVHRMVLPNHADFRLLVLLNLLVVMGVVGIAWLLETLSGQGMMFQFDHAFSQSVRALRTQWTDPLMLAVTLLGDASVVMAVLLAMLLVLAWELRGWLWAGVALTFAAAIVFVDGMKWLVQTVRPVADLYTGVAAFAFPSGHTTVSFTLSGLLGWFVWRGCNSWMRVLFVPVLGVMAVLVAFSRIYLGAHWPSDILAGWLFGIGVLAVFAQIFRMEVVDRRLALRMLAACGLTLAMVGGWHVSQDWSSATVQYARRPPPPLLLPQPWEAGGWAALPAYRMDLAGESVEPFLLQWRSSPPALQQALPGWLAAPDWTVQALNRFAFPNSTAEQLPVLPKLNEGQMQAYALIKPGTLANVEGRYVLRLYPQTVADAGQPLATLWLGTLAFEGLHHPFRQLSLLWPLDEDVACEGTPLLLGLPHAREVGQRLESVKGHACSGRLVLAGD